ncbi:MAG: FAD-dependent oxidoreductase, partial [Chitinophagales bacterium]
MEKQPPQALPHVTAGSNISYWIDSMEPIKTTRLNENLKTDVVVIGGGIAGVTIAYQLLRSGQKVVLIEDGFIGSGETGRTTAHLVNALDDRYYDLQRIFGNENAGLIAQSHTSAIAFIEELVKKENIDCDFTRVDGYLFLHPSDNKDSIEKELRAARESGVDVEEVSEVPGIVYTETPAIKFLRQAKFHPLKYLAGLCKAITRDGGEIFTSTHAREIDHTGIITDEGFTVHADHVVVATNSPVNNRFAMHLKQFAYRSYVIGALVEKDSLPDVLWWDTGDHEMNADLPPYHYVRLQPFNDEFDLLISGGEDHPTGLADAVDFSEETRYAKLKGWTESKFPIGEIIFKWSGQVIEPMDSLAYIGRNPFDKDNVYIVTGDSGNGMTHGTIAGLLITDLINGKENPWEKLYSPSRFKFFKSGKIFLKEFIGGLFAYMKTNPKHPETVELSSVKEGEGKIVELQGEKFGVHRDKANQLHIVAAECTHLQCIKWNNDEKSWDCPCHGSRFTYDGKV